MSMLSAVDGISIPSSFTRRLQGKVALITGGAEGIGKATVGLFCQHGAKVVIADIQDDLGITICSNLGPESAVFVHCDVTKEDDVRRAVDLAVSKYGKLDIVFNNAGILDSLLPRIVDIETSTFERVLRVNVTGVFLGTKHGARVMGAGGCIINNASMSSLVVLGGVTTHAYVASKHVVVGLTKSAATELGRHGIRVNCVSPSLVASSLTSQFYDRVGDVEKLATGQENLKGGVLTVDDIAQAVVYLASDESRYVSGHNLVVDGGFTTINNSFDLLSSTRTM